MSTIYGKGNEAWLRRKKTKNIRRRKRRVVFIIKIIVIRFNIKFTVGLCLI